MSDATDAIQKRFEALKPVLDEQGRRRFAAAEAEGVGHGGVKLLARITGLARSTINRGRDEIKSDNHAGDGRVRKPGGGRKKKQDTDKTLLSDLKMLVEPDTRGDPQQPLLWTSKSLRKLSGALKDMGHAASPNLVRKLLRSLGYSLQGNKKTRDGGNHPDRDDQFKYINAQIKEHLSAGNPVVSVDTKKKELVGDFKNQGREWCPKGTPEEAGESHDIFSLL